MIVLFNPAAGRRRAHLLWRVLDVLSANGTRLEITETTGRGHATELARQAAQAGAPLVVAAGGDGTIAEVASGLIGTTTRLGVIPLGTANVLAQELRLSVEPRAVAAALAFGRTRLLWPGLADTQSGSRTFVQMIGAGLDAQVVHRLCLPLKRAIGRGAYVLQTLRESTRYQYPPLRVTLDGAATETASVIVTKGRLYAGNFTLAPLARPEEPGFWVALFDKGGMLPALGYGAALTLDLLPRMPGCRLVRASRVEIRGADATPAQADGDPAGVTPIVITDAEKPIEVVTG
ncbi:MAG: diacylglycerol kinase family lipid kinase [Acetobacteraceae bacterium]|nr:diacylglycerol kinase family lipid kinase [Acetobacteraceae bacterium]